MSYSASHSEPDPNEKSPLLRAETPLMLAASMFGAYTVIRRSPVLTAGAAFGALGLLLAKDRDRAEAPTRRQYEAFASFAVRCSVQRAYREWRNFENLPRFMPHLESVTAGPDSRSQWTAVGPLGTHFHWSTELVDDIENERIAWRSLPGSWVQNSGSIDFRQGAPGRGIVITLRMLYELPAGALGKAILSVFGRNPEFTAREDLRRFKAFLECGEVPTTVGQPHGPRGVHGHIMHMLLRETSNMAPPIQREQPQSMRGAA